MAENFIEKIREIVVANFSVKSLEKKFGKLLFKKFGEKNSTNCYYKNW